MLTALNVCAPTEAEAISKIVSEVSSIKKVFDDRDEANEKDIDSNEEWNAPFLDCDCYM